MTGHGNVFFNDDDAQNLRLYLESGGFLHIDDNYGMKPYVINELHFSSKLQWPCIFTNWNFLLEIYK